MRKAKSKWHTKGWGMQLGCGTSSLLTNLRFADDILLVGRSLHQVKAMLADVIREGALVGLELHPDKTKIQHNNVGYGSRVRSADISGMRIEVLDYRDSCAYLGRSLSLTEPHDVELQHRISKGWAKFGVFRRELTDRAVPLPLRLKLFHSVITPSILYGSASWVMTTARANKLRAAQMKMLRTVLSRRRTTSAAGEVEPWVEWVIRVTAEVREAMLANGIPDWVEQQRSISKAWTQKLQKMSPERWAVQVLHWKPVGSRRRGRPRTRWQVIPSTAEPA
jgi:hypothetical protein